MRKLILVYSDTHAVFKEFTDAIQSRYPRISRNDEHEIYNVYINKCFGEYKNKRDNQLFVNKIREIVTSYTDHVYNNVILDWLAQYDLGTQTVFFRVDNLYTMNRLKRRFKRPNYITLLLLNSSPTLSKKQILEVNSYKFDYKITRHNSSQLGKEALRYALRQIKMINRYRE